MTNLIRTSLRFSIVAILGATCLFASEKTLKLQEIALTTSADARIGRPLTPVSYAGVARRTTRRTVAYGAAAGAAVAAPVVVAPACVQAVDAYGRVYTRCP
jgi:hypothetical protein